MIRYRDCLVAVVWLMGSVLLGSALAAAEAGRFTQPDPSAHPNLWVWQDTCNVYLWRDGSSALLINCGDGSLLDHLHEIGVTNVEYVLLTDHHREQCQGAQRLLAAGTKFAGPESERELFEQPQRFRPMRVRLSDALTIHGASYVRPPIESIRLDRGWAAGDTFDWHGLRFTCLATPGTSPGGMTYVVEQDGQRLAFSGDVMLDGAVMHTWFDTEWDYGFAAGIQALKKTVSELSTAPPDRMFPAHGPIINDPSAQLSRYAAKLDQLHRLYVRGYGAEAASNAYQDKVSQPTDIPDVAQVSPHLFKFKRTNFWPNFNLILADNGHGLLVDCGLLDIHLLEDTLQALQERHGLKTVDAIVVSHMHGDHFLQAPYMARRWGTKVWALENMVEKMEHPERFDYAAPVQAYGDELTGVQVDRAFRPGETFEWEGYKFTIDWMPGQTEFALCMHGQIDGQLVVFTGDNIFGDPDDPTQTGHEAMVAHNSAILEEGYIYGSELLSRLQPDVIVGGHSFVMGRPAAFIERYRRWSYEMRDAFQALSSETDYRYWFDPYWVRAYPYRSWLAPGQSTTVTLNLRNFRSANQRHRIDIVAPPGLKVEPSTWEGSLGPEVRDTFPVRVTADSTLSPGTHLIAVDVTLDGHRYGQRFDFVIGRPESPNP
ncbi:MAG: MBL fold metallo-hydrolase [Pirellulales bacterium]